MATLEQIEAKVKDIERQTAIFEDRIKTSAETLKTKYGIKNIEQARERLKKITPEIDGLEDKKKEVLAKAEEKLKSYETV